MTTSNDNWNSGDPYEYFMGRWSRLMAPQFLTWLKLPANLKWIDLGCGTGALSEAIYNQCTPSHLTSMDPSREFLDKAGTRLSGKTDLVVGSASAIPLPSQTLDVVVSGLAINFFPELETAFFEMKRVVKPDGVIAAYVWDYSGRMEFLRIFWDTACEIDEEGKKSDEGVRFPLCDRTQLAKSFEKAGLLNIETAFLDIETLFENFEDFWSPFLGGQGPAPGYLASLSKMKQEEFKLAIRKKLPVQQDGSIKLLARAIAVKSICRK
ncbi:MAG TPA: class I SAM-dependent methyltransferase [Chitinophagaceae bacterium]|nr:class I SAM-dependent methyltransferase [Chitinophagaceae bacterium]